MLRPGRRPSRRGSALLACPSTAPAATPCERSDPLPVSSPAPLASAAAAPRSGRRLPSASQGHSFLDPHFPEHAGLHVVQEVTVKGPTSECIGTHPEAALCARRHVD